MIFRLQKKKKNSSLNKCFSQPYSISGKLIQKFVPICAYIFQNLISLKNEGKYGKFDSISFLRTEKVSKTIFVLTHAKNSHTSILLRI